MGFADISRFFSHVYALLIIAISIVLFEVILKIRSVSRCISFYKNSWCLAATTANNLTSAGKEVVSVARVDDGSKLESVECAVCLSKFKEGETTSELYCKHAFHKDCVDRWLQQTDGATCPLCRSSVLVEEAAIKQSPWGDDYYFEEMLCSWFLSWNRTNQLHRLVWAR